MRSPSLAVRRTAQTLQHFTNGPALLRSLVRGDRGSGGEIVFRTRDGAVIHCPNAPGARVPVYEVFAEDAYRVDRVLGGLDADATILDIGAHIGCFTVAAARALPGARIRAYEASPSTAAWLARNIEENAPGGRVEALAVALSAAHTTLTFADNAQGSSLNGLTSPHATGTVDVPAISFGQAVADAGGRVDVVKIDTEGAEYDFVLGSDPAEWSSVRRVVMEYHDVAGRSWADLRDHFAQAGLHEVDRDQATPRQGTVWLERRS